MKISLTLFFSIAAASIIGCTPPHPAPVTQPDVPIVAQPIDSDLSTFGPTKRNRVPEGYELLNNQFRLVISDTTGDVVFWGYVNQPRNMVYHRGLYTTLSALPDSPVKGYVEPRDEDTWQFMGDDENHITWRKIYRLNGDHLEVSILIQNNRTTPIDTAVNINGDLPSLLILHHDPEQFDGSGDYGIVSLHGWNVVHNPTSKPVLPTLLQSDVFHLKPQERQSYTTMWMLSR
jgi:hypothetical protein